jgi:NitT/TauT family transport system substrate-binding protein
MEKKRTFIPKSHLIVLVAGAALVAVVVFFFMRTHRSLANIHPNDKITIAYSSTTDAILAEVALEQGYFLQEGLEVAPHIFPYGKLALNDVLEGKADFATVAETPVMLAIMNGEELSIVATIETSNKNNALVARKDRGILTPNDLKGKRVATSVGTSGDYYLDVYLTLHGIDRKDVTVIYLKAEDLPDALANGKVDAISTFYHYVIYAQRKLGADGITFNDEDIYTFTFNIVAKQEFIHDNPEAVKKMLRALIKAEEFVRRHPDAAQKIDADFSKIELSIVQEMWADRTYTVALDQSLVLALEDESRWAIEGGLTTQKSVPDYLDYIYVDGLMSVKPEAVRFLK